MATVLDSAALVAAIDAARDDAPRVGRAAVLGSPVDHSLSPALHLAAYASLGLDGWTFERFAIGGAGEPTMTDLLEHVLVTEAMDPTPWRGFAVTMPLKEDALAVADLVSERAVRVGAANTLVRAGKGWAAENTDVAGLRHALRGAGAGDVTTAVLLGGGATARAALETLAGMGCTAVTFAVRRAVRTGTLAVADALGLKVDTIALADGEAVRASVRAAPVTICTLPTGTALDLPHLTGGELAHVIAMDAAYGGWPTAFARWAEAGGARVVSGLPMLLHQGVAQVRLMTGRDPDTAVVRRALQEATGPDGW